MIRYKDLVGFGYYAIQQRKKSVVVKLRKTTNWHPMQNTLCIFMCVPIILDRVLKHTYIPSAGWYGLQEVWQNTTENKFHPVNIMNCYEPSIRPMISIEVQVYKPGYELHTYTNKQTHMHELTCVCKIYSPTNNLKLKAGSSPIHMVERFMILFKKLNLRKSLNYISVKYHVLRIRFFPSKAVPIGQFW